MSTHPYLGAEQALVDQWVEGQLLAAAADFDAIEPGLSQRIYLDSAPFDALYPFVIYQCSSPPRDVRGVGVSRVLVDTLYIVKAVAQVQTYVPLAPIASVIDAAMTSPAGSSLLGGAVFASVRDDQFAMVEIDSGTQYRHFGGQYRIQAQG